MFSLSWWTKFSMLKLEVRTLDITLRCASSVNLNVIHSDHGNVCKHIQKICYTSVEFMCLSQKVEQVWSARKCLCIITWSVFWLVLSNFLLWSFAFKWVARALISCHELRTYSFFALACSGLIHKQVVEEAKSSIHENIGIKATQCFCYLSAILVIYCKYLVPGLHACRTGTHEFACVQCSPICSRDFGPSCPSRKGVSVRLLWIGWSS